MTAWHDAGPELSLAVAAYAATAAGAYLVAGLSGVAVVSIAAAGIALVGVRALLPGYQTPGGRLLRDKPMAQSLSGYSRRRYLVTHAAESAGFYESELRPVLEHILAARLADRHNMTLDAAPALLGDTLWYWIDPAVTDRPRGIPPRTLARLINRLERL